MPNNETPIEISLTPSEVFQLNLCVIARLSTVQIKYANAHNEEEQRSAEGQINYLTALSGKLTSQGGLRK